MQRRYRFFPLWLLRLGIVLYGSLSLAGSMGRKFAAPLCDAALLAVGVKVGLTLRYHPDLVPAPCVELDPQERERAEPALDLEAGVRLLSVGADSAP